VHLVVGEAYHPSSELVHQVQGSELAVDARGVLRGQEAGALAFSLGPSEVVATYGFAEPCEAVELGDGACKAAGEIAWAHRELAVAGGESRGLPRPPPHPPPPPPAARPR